MIALGWSSSDYVKQSMLWVLVSCVGVVRQLSCVSLFLLVVAIGFSLLVLLFVILVCMFMIGIGVVVGNGVSLWLWLYDVELPLLFQGVYFSLSCY